MITRTITVVEYALCYYDVDAKEEFVINCEIDKARFNEKDCIRFFEENNPTAKVIYIELLSEETHKYGLEIDKFLMYAKILDEVKKDGCNDSDSID